MTAAHYDLVAIGMGAAGLPAALSFAEAAAAQRRRGRVAVVERAPVDERGAPPGTRAPRFVTEIAARSELVGLMELISGGSPTWTTAEPWSEGSHDARLPGRAPREGDVGDGPLPIRHAGGRGSPVGGGAAIVEAAGSLEARTGGSSSTDEGVRLA